MGDSQRIQVPAFITALVLIPMVLRDLFVGQIDYGWYHIAGKSFFFVACVGIGLYARYRVRGEAPGLLIAIILIVILNCAHSLSYEPAFHAGYNTTLLLALFVYNKSMRGFFGILLFSYVLLVVTLFVSGVQPGDIYIREWRTSVLLDHFFISLIIWLLYQGLIKQMQERDFLYGQFLDIGRKTSMIVHDLKGGLASPLLYAEIARERTNDPKQQEILGKLKDDLQFLSLYANELNQFMAKSDHLTKEFFPISEAVHSLATLAANELAHIHIVIEGDYEAHLNKNLLRRILMNAFLNAAEAATETAQRLTVTVKVLPESIFIEDDGPGFPENVLKQVRRGQSLTTKKTGSGLGCRIMAEYAKLMGGKVAYRNSETGGACVEISIPGMRVEKISEQRVEIWDVPF